MNKKRFGFAFAIALLGLLLLILFRSPRPAQPVATTEEDRAAVPASFVPRFEGPVPTAEPTAAPVIESVSVEKTEVCSGEDNLVTVKLAAGYAGNNALRIMMPGHDVGGPQMPFLLSLTGDDKRQPEMPEVVVLGLEGELAKVKIPPVKVKNCTPDPSLTIEAALVANATDTFAFTATIRNPGKQPFKPVEWRWDFGDGADAVTKVRTVEHGYGDRPQTTRMSDFLVHVRAVDAEGVELLGRYGMELRNRAFEALRVKNAILLSTELNPRFPTMGADGRVVERVRIHHAYDKPVIIRRLFLQRFRNNEGREDIQQTEVDPRQILGTDVIPPGRGIETTATLDTRAEPETALLTFDIAGNSVDGIRASGQFSVLRPSELIPKEEREVVTDARLRAEILAVRKILGRDEVTIDEIVQLRREGALDNLTGDDGQPLKAGGDDELQPVAQRPKPRKGR